MHQRNLRCGKPEVTNSEWHNLSRLGFFLKKFFKNVSWLARNIISFNKLFLDFFFFSGKEFSESSCSIRLLSYSILYQISFPMVSLGLVSVYLTSGYNSLLPLVMTLFDQGWMNGSSWFFSTVKILCEFTGYEFALFLEEKIS